MTTRTITAEDQLQREQLVLEAIHNGEMEGLTLSPSGYEEAEAYAAGRIDADDLVTRARARHGLA
ncbi:antitoxin VbhA family protein [Rothia halotolerans]|uniref:antitoxin VbhA family protein n=1 Tax=Rothia halotolerans TaxID=405770 RepID=UPI00101C73A1|nr:antitoxin VbhA family protein [Rothia halotolerans]